MRARIVDGLGGGTGMIEIFLDHCVQLAVQRIVARDMQVQKFARGNLLCRQIGKHLPCRSVNSGHVELSCAGHRMT